MGKRGENSIHQVIIIFLLGRGGWEGGVRILYIKW